MTEQIEHGVGGERAHGRLSVVLALWLVTQILLLAAIGLIVAKITQKKPTMELAAKVLTNVETMEIVPREYRESLVLPARLEADRRADLSFELGGRIERWLVAEGQAVKESQALAELNTDDLEAGISELQTRRQSAEARVNVSGKAVEAARLSLEKARTDAKSLQTEVASAEANFEYASKESARVERLAKSDILTQADRDRVVNLLTQAKLSVVRAKDTVASASVGVRVAEVRVAEAEALLVLNRAQVAEIERGVETLRVTLAKTRIVAPFAGRFDACLVEVGDVVSPGMLVGRLHDLRVLRAVVDVPDRYTPFLDDGNEMVEKYIAMAMSGSRRDVRASVRMPGLPKLTGGHYAGIELAAKLARVSQAADPASNTFVVELRFDNPGGAFKEGIIAEGRIDFLVYDDAIVIPVKAVQVTDNGSRVLVVVESEGKSVVQVRDVTPVSIRGAELLVTGDLRAGDRLVVSGGKGVIDGEEVDVVQADGAARKVPENTNGEYIKMPSADESDAGDSNR
ncbi:MAG: efflux RND transporter periplasmic adaptor subunit [Lentisphaeria bacterium]|nr:efflux RND transporter periplasmic adaptor subunit [Lentisphaeria bacterium]